MTITALSAANAYRNQMRLQSELTDAVAQDETSKSSFSSLLKEGLQSAVDSQYKAESMKMEATVGKVDLSDLVTAVSNAELTLNTVVAIRDRVISAYQDIIRMPI